MSDILSELKRLGVTMGFPQKPAVLQKTGDVFRRLEAAFPEGFTAENRFGPYFINRCRYPLTYTHGSVRMDQELAPTGLFRALIGRSDIKKEETLAMDTETSGLTSDAAAFIFMIGMGYYADDAYIVDQLILPDLGYEKAFIHQIEVIFARFPVILTYNGKSFDVPMIRSRGNFHFFPDFCASLHHIDFLPIARRFWRRTLPNCRLATIEQEILKVRRGEAEVPGFMAPEIYREFLNTLEADRLKGIAYHNEIDVLSLTALLLFLSGITRKGLYQPDSLNEHRMSVPEFYRSAMSLSPEEADLSHYLDENLFSVAERRLTAATLRKRGALEQSLRVYQALAENGDILSCYEAARLHEKMEQPEQAIALLEKGILLLEASEATGHWSRQSKAEQFRNRIAQIRRKAK